MRVLVIDDDPDALRIASDILRLTGHEVVALPDFSGIQKYADVDAAVIDLFLPGLDGVACSRILRRLANRMTPVVFLSAAHPRSPLMVEAAKQPAAEVVAKGPAAARVLPGVIERLSRMSTLDHDPDRG